MTTPRGKPGNRSLLPISISIRQLSLCPEWALFIARAVLYGTLARTVSCGVCLQDLIDEGAIPERGRMIRPQQGGVGVGDHRGRRGRAAQQIVCRAAKDITKLTDCSGINAKFLRLITCNRLLLCTHSSSEVFLPPAFFLPQFLDSVHTIHLSKLLYELYNTGLCISANTPNQC